MARTKQTRARQPQSQRGLAGNVRLDPAYYPHAHPGDEDRSTLGSDNLRDIPRPNLVAAPPAAAPGGDAGAGHRDGSLDGVPVAGVDGKTVLVCSLFLFSLSNKSCLVVLGR